MDSEDFDETKQFVNSSKIGLAQLSTRLLNMSMIHRIILPIRTGRSFGGMLCVKCSLQCVLVFGA